MKMLTRDDVDKLLRRDKIGRAATHNEILLLQEETEKRKTELGLKKKEKLPNVEFQKIITKLKLEDVEFKF